MYLKCSKCKGVTWVGATDGRAYRVDTGCPCGKDFVLHCRDGKVVRAEGCKVVKRPV